LDVERIATPKPFNTRGKEVVFAYFLRPGVLILSNFVMAGSLVSGLYFKAILMTP
jgi:hypothetical protein